MSQRERADSSYFFLLPLRRDLKCSNVLMNNKGDVKLADFGLARKMGDKARMTPKVITLWYRPPELLLGHDGQSKNLGAVYSEAVDMWSAGCILAELLLEAPLLPGKEEGDQIYKIFDMFGKPTNREWPGVENFALWDRIVKKGGQNFRNSFEETMRRNAKHPISDPCMDLLKGLLAMDPKMRMGSYEACTHTWFHERPKLGYFNSPTYDGIKKKLAGVLTKIDDSHEYEQRLKRKREKQGRPMNKRFV